LLPYLGMSSNCAVIHLDSEALGRLRKRQNQVIYAGKPDSQFLNRDQLYRLHLGAGLDLHVACSGRGGISWNRAETLALYY
jgi:hypothetical protein